MAFVSPRSPYAADGTDGAAFLSALAVEQLEGTSRLMAELAYGAGLRLMELLRLRVQDLDLARGRVMVDPKCAGGL